jgi:ribosomal protein S12 methylthiotransferase
VDSEVMSASLLRAGFSFVPDPGEAEVILLNSCGFIRDAVEESLQFLDSLGRYKEAGSCRCLVLTGCLVGRYGKALQRQLPHVDLFVGMKAQEEIGGILAGRLRGASSRSFFLRAPPAAPGSPRWFPSRNRQALGAWAYVKIAEGCSNRCSYCTLPAIRGPLKSRTPREICREVSHLARAGVQEINLVAQDVAAYGRDRVPPGDAPLPELLRELHRIRDLRWIRLLYCHPAHVDEPLVSALADLEKICPYLDLPIQHASRPVLRAMNRSYDVRMLNRLIRRLRTARPDIALRTTVMVGFPGEKREDVRRLLRFLEEVRFHHLGVFCYSPEPGTPAHPRGDPVPQEEKEARFREVMGVQAGISESIQKTYLGTLQTVLVEGEHEEEPGMLRARTRFQAPEVDGAVKIRANPAVLPGLNTARITGCGIYDLRARICRGNRS